MKTARITIIAGYNVFIELAKSIEYSLKELGINNIDIEDLNTKNQKQLHRHYAKKVDLTFVIKAFRPYNPVPVKGIKILFQPEELWNRRERGVYFGLDSGYFDRVLEMYDENCKLRNTQNVVYCPVGYSPVWENNLPEVEEDIDILFHGGLTDRRKKFLKMFQNMGLNIIFTQNKYGIERDKLIMRSKIDINIKAHDRWSYGPLHCLPAQANGKFMLAEKANGGYGPFKSGLHVAEYDGLKDCKEKVLYWLEHKKERKEFAKAALEDMKKTCNFTEILKNALKGIL